MSCYTFSQLEAFAVQGGFPQPMAPVMAAIAMAESGGCSVVQQGQPPDKTGWGLWQITPGDASLLDPAANAKAAYAKWRSQGLNAWTTFTGGRWKQFLPYGYSGIMPGGAPPSSGGGFPDPGGIVGAAGGAVSGAAGAAGGAVSSVLGIPGQLVGGVAGSVAGDVTSAITGGLTDVGKHLLPYLIILGAMGAVFWLLLHEMGSKLGSGAAPSAGQAGKAARGGSLAEGMAAA